MDDPNLLMTLLLLIPFGLATAAIMVGEWRTRGQRGRYED